MPSSRQESSLPATSADSDTAASAHPVSDIAAPVAAAASPEPRRTVPLEIGGREGPEPTRFGDWERRGRCIDF